MPDLPRLLIWGSSGHASVVADVVLNEARFEVAGLIDDMDPRARQTPSGPVLGGRDVLPRLLREGVAQILVGIGDNSVRRRLAEHAQKIGFGLARAVHPRATVAAGVSVGPGTVIMAGAVINPGARIGSNVIVNTSASIDHHCLIGDGSFVGIGTVVRERIRIGSECTIGAGSVVVSDLPDGVLALGCPARPVRASSRSTAER